MKELSPDINWDKVIDKHDQEMLEKTTAEVFDIKDRDQVHIDEVTVRVNEANKYIRATAIDFESGTFNPDLYDTYRFKVFIRGGEVTIIQGKEYDTEKEEWK